MTIHPTWDVAGLRATASNDTSLNDFAVDRRHTCSFGDRPWADGPLWRLPLFVALAPTLAAVGLGVARGALDAINGQALARAAQMRGSLLDDHVGMADLGAADALLRGRGRACSTRSTRAGREPNSGIRSTDDSRPGHSSRRSTASTSQSRVAGTCHRLGGGAAAYRPSPLLRAVRDLETARQHAMFNRGLRSHLGARHRGQRRSPPAFRRVSADRARPRARRRQALVDEIVEAADALVHEVGLAGLSMRDLGTRVGLHSSSLYQYFPSKLDIYDALFARWHRQLEAWMSTFDRDGDPEQVFRIGSARFTAFCMADPVRYQLLFQRTIPDFVPSEESMALARASFADMAAVLARLGVVDSVDLDLWTAVQMGLADQQLANEPGGDRWIAQLDRAIDMFLAYVRPRQPSSRRKKV